jgi:hypothetical protein
MQIRLFLSKADPDPTLYFDGSHKISLAEACHFETVTVPTSYFPSYGYGSSSGLRFLTKFKEIIQRTVRTLYIVRSGTNSFGSPMNY